MRQWLYIVVAVALIASASLLIPGVNEMRAEHGLTSNPVLENVPPELALATTALGGFRGIIVDMLWLRAMKLQQQEKFFELVQLFDWIGKLEPRSAPVWVFSAWNMAYNISVEMPTASERWRWIRLGMDQLRNHGLRYNKRSSDLYREMAWIYQNKIGNTVDDFHWYYKTQLAKEMEDVFGRGPITDLKPFLKAPRTLEELRARLDPKPILAALGAVGYKPLKDPLSVLTALDDEKSDAREVLDRPEFAEDRETFIMFLRNWAIKNVLRMDLDYMVQLQNEIGPMDWRLPEPYTLYYSGLALKYAGKKDFTPNYYRLRYEAVRRLYKGGSLFFDRGKGGEKAVYLTSSNWRFFDAADAVYRNAIAAEADRPNVQRSFKNAHATFMEEGVVLFYACSQVKRARELYRKLQKEYPNERHSVSFDRFVINKLIPDPAATTAAEATVLINGVLMEAYRWLAAGNDERAKGLFNLAAKMRRYYMFDKENQGTYTRRVQIPEFATLNAQARKKALGKGALPEVLRRRLMERLGVKEKPEEKPKKAKTPEKPQKPKK